MDDFHFKSIIDFFPGFMENKVNDILKRNNEKNLMEINLKRIQLRAKERRAITI